MVEIHTLLDSDSIVLLIFLRVLFFDVTIKAQCFIQKKKKLSNKIFILVFVYNSLDNHVFSY